MKWPFARHTHAPESPPLQRLMPGDPIRVPSSQTDGGAEEGVAASRREWATLPPLQVAGGRPISLTAAARAFADGLASRQVLVRSARLEHVRHMDAPSGSFRGVLAPSPADHDAAAPELHEPSPLPAIEHRQLGAATGEPRGGRGLSPVEQLLAIGEPSTGGAPLPAPIDVATPPPPDSDDGISDGGSPSGRRRAG
ncbi:MAG: hypothetical protein ACXVIH_01505, partial [Ilumatobacteraceae bacterium]